MFFPAIFLTVVYLISSHINDWLAICAAEGMMKSPGDTRVVLSFMPPLAFLVGHSSFPAIFTADSLLSSLSVIRQSYAAEVLEVTM